MMGDGMTFSLQNYQELNPERRHAGWFAFADGRLDFLDIPPWMDGDAFACTLTDLSDVPVKFDGHDPHLHEREEIKIHV